MKITITKPIGYITESDNDFEYYKTTKEMLFELTKRMDSEQRNNLCKGLLNMHKQDHNIGEFGIFTSELIFSRKE